MKKQKLFVSYSKDGKMLCDGNRHKLRVFWNTYLRFKKWSHERDEIKYACVWCSKEKETTSKNQVGRLKVFWTIKKKKRQKKERKGISRAVRKFVWKSCRTVSSFLFSYFFLFFSEKILRTKICSICKRLRFFERLSPVTRPRMGLEIIFSVSFQLLQWTLVNFVRLLSINKSFVKD